LIHYCRGRIAILDRSGLELNVCECYRAVEDEVDRLLRRRKKSDFNPVGAAAAQESPLTDPSCRPELAKRYAQLPFQHPQRGV
jgi:hypothetical protein